LEIAGAHDVIAIEHAARPAAANGQAAGRVTDCTTYGPGPGTQATVTFACSGTIIVPEILITTDTVIAATGQMVVLSGNNANRVLRVQGVRLDLVRVTLTGGNSARDGGGLYAYFFAAVMLTNSTVSGNSAPSGWGVRRCVSHGPHDAIRRHKEMTLWPA
jgi:hypothetical protein